MRKEKSDINNDNARKNKITLKMYIQKFITFFKEKMLKTTRVSLILSLILIALFIKPIIESSISNETNSNYLEQLTLAQIYSSRIQILFVTIIAGFVPYIYAPVVGFVGIVLEEVTNIVDIIKVKGYLGGFLIGIFPMILNIFNICLVVSLGIYICRSVTVNYKISGINNMNLINFRIKLYQILRNEKKLNEQKTKKDKKLKMLQDKKEKLNYIQIINVVIIVCIIQFITVLLHKILI